MGGSAKKGEGGGTQAEKSWQRRVLMLGPTANNPRVF
jgi:hypothetical protein